MILAWVALGVAAVWALLRLGRMADAKGRGEWRVTATVFAAAAFGGAALAAMRGAWLAAGLLVVLGLWLAGASRARPPQPGRAGLSEAEARSILGVGPEADETEIRTAWRRLMSRAHPDAGGTEGLAERLNAARDRLLRRP